MDATCTQFEHWVKAILIKSFIKENSWVCEFNPGDGKDAGKWQRAKVAHLTSIDNHQINLERLIDRYVRKNFPSLPLTLQFNICQHKIDWSQPQQLSIYTPSDTSNNNITVLPEVLALPTHAQKYSAVACFAGLDCAFTHPLGAETLIYNASQLLEDGGVFFGIMPDSSVLFTKANKQKITGGIIPSKVGYELVIPEGCTVQQAFDCEFQHLPFILRNTPPAPPNELPLYLVHCPTFIQICAKYGLMVLEIQNYVDFYEENRQFHDITLKKMMGALKIHSHHLQRLGLFTTFAFRKTTVSIPSNNIPAR